MIFSSPLRQFGQCCKGPIVDNEGKERLPKDAMPDQAWKDKVDFYVKGVDGKIPAGK